MQYRITGHPCAVEMAAYGHLSQGGHTGGGQGGQSALAAMTVDVTGVGEAQASPPQLAFGFSQGVEDGSTVQPPTNNADVPSK